MAALNWSNQTHVLSYLRGSPATVGGVAAYDPEIQQLVYFGGSTHGGAVSNATWSYNGDYWTNLTSKLATAPPPVRGTTMAWDPEWSGILLTGGVLPGGKVSGQTWVFTSAWTNVTAQVDGTAVPTSPSEAFGSMAYDDTLHAMIVVDGCRSVSAGCANHLAGETYALSGPGSTWQNLSLTLTPGAPFPGGSAYGGYDAQMAFDRSDQEMVYFGGEASSGSIRNSTWLMTSTGWVNATSTSDPGACSGCYPKGGSALGSMTWDGQLSAIVLVIGANTTAAPFGDRVSYLFHGGLWSLAASDNPNLANPEASSGSTMPVNSTDVAPILFVGNCTAGPSCIGDEWVLEVPPQPEILPVSPNPVDVGVPLEIQVTDPAGAGSGPSVTEYIYDTAAHGHSSAASPVNFTTAVSWDASFVYTSPGTVTIDGSEIDFFGENGSAPGVTVTVGPGLASAPAAAPAFTEVGGPPVHFFSQITGGVPPYRIGWAFGDSGTSSLPAPFHNYSGPGWYNVTLDVGDAGGGFLTPAPVEVHVAPALSVAITPVHPIGEADLPLLFVAEPDHGSGTYTSFRWTFGTAGAATVEDPSENFTAAGVYPVALAVADSFGVTSVGTDSYVVNPPLEVGNITGASALTPPGATLTFRLDVSGGVPPYRYNWTFGDGASSTAAVPSHAFNSTGTYTVSVVVTDADGAESVRTSTVRSDTASASLLTEITTPPYVFGVLGAVGAGAAVLVRRGIRARAASSR